MAQDHATRIENARREVGELRQDVEALFVIAMKLFDMGDDGDEADELRRRATRVFGTHVYASYGIQESLAKVRDALRDEATETDTSEISHAAE
jgi:hypothetical protein